MSLLSSLIQAGAQFQQAMEKKSPASKGGEPGPANGKAQATEAATSATDDRFTRSGDNPADLATLKARNLSITDYKQAVGQDLAFVRETLRHKLAEYQLNPGLALNVSRDDRGGVQLGGGVPQEQRQRIEQDLNNNKPFREAFSRLSANEPTLHFVDTALKLSQAYGVNNSLLDTIVSENQQFNGLQDLVHRYDSVRRSVSTGDSADISSPRGYALSLNARA